MGTGDLHLTSLRWVDQTVRQVVLGVEHPWVGPMVVQAERQVVLGVEHPWVEPKVVQVVWPADPEVEHPWVGLMVVQAEQQVGRQQEKVEVPVAPLVGHQIPREVGQMQVCLRARMEDPAEKLEGRVVVHPSGGPKEGQVEFDWQGWTTTANLSAMIQRLPSQAQKSPFQRHQRWFLVLLVVPHLIHPWPLEGAQVRR